MNEVLSKPIGIFDSGLGGLTVLKELKLTLPHESFIYLGDTARTPYGSKGYETIVRYSKECANFLINKEIKLLVVACNTASSLALDVLRSQVACPVIGTINEAVNQAVEISKRKKIGVIGTDATIASSVYQERIKSLSLDVEVFAKSCPLFVPLVEQGMFDGEIVDKIVELYLKDFKDKEIDVLILGCTHYPLLKDAIGKYLGLSVNIVECSRAIANEVGGLLSAGSKKANVPKQKTAGDIYYITDGVSRFNQLAQVFLGYDSVSAAKIEL
jgi:glutamate racemase